jgi:hypothetical protein
MAMTLLDWIRSVRREHQHRMLRNARWAAEAWEVPTVWAGWLREYAKDRSGPPG